MNRSTLVLALINFLSASAHADSSVTMAKVNANFDKNPCYGKALGVLTSWSPEYRWRELPATGTDLQFVSVIAGGNGSVSLGNDKETKNLTLKKDSANEQVKVSWKAPECVAEFKYLPKNGNPELFNDSDLSELLKSKEQGLIYAYSDHMHLSLDGKKIIEKLAKKMKLPVEFLSDPESPTSKGKRLASAKLFNEGMTLHYPSLMVYAHNKIVSPMLPGLKNKAEYRAFIEGYLSK